MRFAISIVGLLAVCGPASAAPFHDLHYPEKACIVLAAAKLPAAPGLVVTGATAELRTEKNDAFPYAYRLIRFSAKFAGLEVAFTAHCTWDPTAGIVVGIDRIE